MGEVNDRATAAHTRSRLATVPHRRFRPIGPGVRRATEALAEFCRRGRRGLKSLAAPLAARIARAYLKAAPRDRRWFEAAGVHLEAAGYYSPIPSTEEVLGSFEYQGDGLPFNDPRVFDDARLTAMLEALIAYAHEFDPPLEGRFDAPDRFFWKNPMFTHSDALTYYCMVRHLRPRRIIEVGSGFSTRVALEALERNGYGSVVCIEPYPPSYLRQLGPRLEGLVEERVQDLPRSFFDDELEDGDILFIDSSHSVKVGSDCVYLYLTVLPHLRPKVMVHAHDVFLPRAFPPAWALEHQLYWTEPYLLYALLLDNPKFEVTYGAQYQMARHPDRLDALMGGKFGPSIGCSLWFRRT